MDADEEYWVTEAMIRYGRDFVEALGRTFRLADAVNAEKIKTTFPKLWEYYAGLAPKARRDRDAEERELIGRLGDGSAEVLALKGDDG